MHSLVLRSLGLLAALISAPLAWSNPRAFFEAFLFAYVFWIGLPLGSLAFLMIHHLVGGNWGTQMRPIFVSSVRTLPLMALLFIPLLFGLHFLYPWQNPITIATDAIVRHKTPYLNGLFFAIRAALYFVIWIGVSRGFFRRRFSDYGVQKLASAGLVAYGFTASFAGIDWVMSLEAHWSSTIWGMVFVLGQALLGFSFTLIAAAILGIPNRKKLYLDLGNILLAVVMLWAYLSFMQYLVVWSGDLPHEVEWFLKRSSNGWQYLVLVLAVFQFAAPFLFLLFRRTKNHAPALALIALTLCIAHAVEVYWMIIPAVRKSPRELSGLDFSVVVGLGCAWLLCFLSGLQNRRLR